jgi:hypothetical protein
MPVDRVIFRAAMPKTAAAGEERRLSAAGFALWLAAYAATLLLALRGVASLA